MLNDLTDSQRQLAAYMSELSEEAFSTGWMEGLEFILWDGMNHEIDEFGRLKFTEDIISELKNLSTMANGWIIFDDDREEIFVCWKDWNVLKKKSLTDAVPSPVKKLLDVQHPKHRFCNLKGTCK